MMMMMMRSQVPLVAGRNIMCKYQFCCINFYNVITILQEYTNRKQMIKSKEQLNHLFFNDDIHVWDNGKTERYNIPVSERMYVIEDIDAMGDLVLKREWKKPVSKKV